MKAGAVLDNRWARIGLALIAGAGAALAHPPFGIVLGLLGYPLLMILAERSGRVRGAFWMGWLAGFAYFFISCWWVAEAFFVNPEQAWMAPFAASLLPAGLGLFFGTACALYRRIGARGVSRVFLFAALFVLLEWLRGHVLTGFPWNPAGAAWNAGSAPSQAAAVVGVYGLSLITLIAFGLIGALFGPERRRARIGAHVAGLAMIAGLYGFGSLRLSGASVDPTGPMVRIVQANIEQATKWSPETYRSIVDRYVTLTQQPAAVTPDLVIWPEGALPSTANAVFQPGAEDGMAIAGAILPGQTLLMGIGRGEADASAEDGARYFNSLLVLHAAADLPQGQGLRITTLYDKHRLVPFGEYLPLGALMSRLGVRSLVHMPADFSPGPKPAPIDLPNAPRVQPLICYESLYPGFTPGGADRPDWIVNVSNDAWFGGSSGPLQHLNLASYRAIETGLAVVRATPTGVSAMIDPWGRVIEGQSLKSGQSGVIDARLPRPAGITPYGRWGDVPLWVMMIGALAAGVAPGLSKGAFPRGVGLRRSKD